MTTNDIFNGEVGDGSETKHAVYKYVYQNQTIIYIGKTDYSVKQRVSDHAKDEKFKPYLKDTTIYYSETASTLDTCIWEKLLINKYKPILNVIDNYEDSKIVGVSMSPRKWKRFEDFSTLSTNTRNKQWQKPKPVGSVNYEYNDNDLVIQEIFEKYGMKTENITDAQLINLISHGKSHTMSFFVTNRLIIDRFKEAIGKQHKNSMEIIFYQSGKKVFTCSFSLWNSLLYNKDQGMIQVEYDVYIVNLFYRYLKYNINNPRVLINIVDGQITK